MEEKGSVEVAITGAREGEEVSGLPEEEELVERVSVEGEITEAGEGEEVEVTTEVK